MERRRKEMDRCMCKVRVVKSMSRLSSWLVSLLHSIALWVKVKNPIPPTPTYRLTHWSTVGQLSTNALTTLQTYNTMRRQCVGRRVGSVLADASMVSRPMHGQCVGDVSTNALANVLADASVGSDSLPLPLHATNDCFKPDFSALMPENCKTCYTPPLSLLEQGNAQPQSSHLKILFSTKERPVISLPFSSSSLIYSRTACTKYEVLKLMEEHRSLIYLATLYLLQIEQKNICVGKGDWVYSATEN